jgi:diguanylate cyclase (GGDEF)-like protein
MWGVERKVFLDVTLVAGMLGLAGVMMLGSVGMLDKAVHDLEATEVTQSLLLSIQSKLAQAQSGQRDFLLTNDATRLDACQDSLFGVEKDLSDLHLRASDQELDGGLRELEPLVLRQIEFYKKTFEARRKRGLRAAAALLRNDGSSRVLERVQLQIQAILQQQTQSLKQRFARLQGRLALLRLVVLLCGAAAAGLSVWAYRLIQSEMRQRLDSTRRLEQSLQELKHLGGLVEALQASQTVEEVCQTAGPRIQCMFPDLAVTLALSQGGGGRLLKRFATRATGETRDFEAVDCWALRRGQPHLDDATQGMHCRHFGADSKGLSLCVPLSAQGANLGLLSLQVSPGGQLDEDRQKLAVVTAEQLSLALANLALRERLKEQSVLDPLTGLFNRRYMEESFERERERHADRGRVFSVLMADIDHFKLFNDRYGHKAGDHVLRSIADSLRRTVRPRDIVCRYGGEEMVLLLPDSDLEQALRCAEHCRQSVESLRLVHDGRSLGPVTLSLGVASFPGDGESIEALLHCADTNLYAAKHGGRNRIHHHSAQAPGPALLKKGA